MSSHSLLSNFVKLVSQGDHAKGYGVVENPQSVPLII